MYYFYLFTLSCTRKKQYSKKTYLLGMERAALSLTGNPDKNKINILRRSARSAKLTN